MIEPRICHQILGFQTKAHRIPLKDGYSLVSPRTRTYSCRVEYLHNFAFALKEKYDHNKDFEINDIDFYPFQKDAIGVSLYWDYDKLLKYYGGDLERALYGVESLKDISCYRDFVDNIHSKAKDIKALLSYTLRAFQYAITKEKEKSVSVEIVSAIPLDVEVKISSVFLHQTLYHLLLGIIRDCAEIVLYGYQDEFLAHKDVILNKINHDKSINQIIIKEILPLWKTFSLEEHRRILSEDGHEAMLHLLNKGAVHCFSLDDPAKADIPFVEEDIDMMETWEARAIEIMRD